MSYNTDLQNNNTSLQEILATINNLPEAESGSGAEMSLETCTLNFYNDSTLSYGICLVFENGEIKNKIIENNYGQTSIDNVLIDSLLICYFDSSTMCDRNHSNGLLHYNNNIYTISIKNIPIVNGFVNISFNSI